MVKTMRYLIIENGVVVNAVVADQPLADNWIAHDLGNIGDRWVDGALMPPQVDEALLAAQTRNHRNYLLAASDWTQVNDAPVDRAAWAVYRQALRDVPQQAGFPNVIEWPVAPA